MTHFPHFGHNKDSPLKSKAATLHNYQCLSSEIIIEKPNNEQTYIQKCWFWANKWAIHPILDTIRIFLEIPKKITFIYFLMPVIKYNFRRNLIHKFRESSKSLILGYKIRQLRHFGHTKDFSEITGSIIFICLLNLNLMQKIGKK